MEKIKFVKTIVDNDNGKKYKLPDGYYIRRCDAVLSLKDRTLSVSSMAGRTGLKNSVIVCTAIDIETYDLDELPAN